ncbi:MAG: hypothetical protein OEY01_16570 [Desulfobulbaceae bacterium]|nr:hypothetical protein [Desulfobulbaceae bacterium]
MALEFDSPHLFPSFSSLGLNTKLRLYLLDKLLAATAVSGK